ncbi:MAG TPA: hypothetical protein VEY70_13220 [Metabacillus sp.]|nr:hypothetical protein [Metabacillus sp.]
MYSILEAIAKVIGYSCFFYGLWLLVGGFLQGHIERGIRAWKRKREIKRLNQLIDIRENNKEKGAIYKHLELLLGSLKSNKSVNVYNLMMLSATIFITTFIMMNLTVGDILFSFIISVGFGLQPYIFLRFKLANMRLNTSYAFLMEYHTILQNYQTTGKDIYYTMLNVVKDLESKELKKTFQKLLSSLQKDRSIKEFEKAINIFAYSINSTFAKRFAKLLSKAYLDNADISNSLMDLNNDIKKRKQDMEKDRTEKTETIILGFSPIVLLPLFIFMAYRISGVIDFKYLFFQDLPLTVFIIVILLSITSVLSAYLLSKPRADI